ncbi:MAG TPA: nucleoside phosphorylase [Anaerovoracaceae bacterium]|nr:nucleoside phosphorylase [Anaerovoracaceae bacterium]
MTLFHSFDKEKRAILNPEDIIKKVASFPDTVVVTFKQQILEIMLETFAHEKVTEMDLGGNIPVYKIQYKGKPLAFYKTVMGAAGAVSLMEESIAMGGRKFVIFGSCGTLDCGIDAGNLIVPTAAYRDEGTSYHYMEPGDYIEVETAETTARILRELGLQFTGTKTWTTDGLYRETRHNMRNRISEGCKVVDMECSAFMAAAKFNGTPGHWGKFQRTSARCI